MIVGAIVELKHRSNTEISVAENEVRGQAVVAIPDGSEIVAFLNADDLREADLSQNDMVRIGTNQSLVELLLDRREYLLREDRPVFRPPSPALLEQAQFRRGDESGAEEKQYVGSCRT